jgi:hypothetical protein
VKFGRASVSIGQWMMHESEDGSFLFSIYGIGSFMSFAPNGESQEISSTTGLRILNEVNFCSYLKNVRTVVFGNLASNCGAGDNLFSERYNDIEELNTLLKQERPNVLIITSEWPETYSYTLSIAMLTELPIIVLNTSSHFYSAISSRLMSYNNSFFHDFKNLTDLVRLADSVKVPYLRLIDSSKSASLPWKNIFHPVLYNVVLIASKIIPSKHPLWYHSSRSRFSLEDRYLQTIETIRSVRQYIPNSYIVFIDNSDFQARVSHELRSLVNLFVNDVDDRELIVKTDLSEAKQLGELSLLASGISALERNKVMYRNLFKLTGRYILNSRFKYQTFDNSRNIFKIASSKHYIDAGKTFYAYTCFFKISYGYIEVFKSAIKKLAVQLQTMMTENIPVHLHDDLEARLPWMLPDVMFVSNLGVTQRVSVWDTPDTDI